MLNNFKVLFKYLSALASYAKTLLLLIISMQAKQTKFIKKIMRDYNNILVVLGTYNNIAMDIRI